MSALAVIVPGAGCAVNAALYAADGSPWSLGAAIFCGILTIFNLLDAAS